MEDGATSFGARISLHETTGYEPVAPCVRLIDTSQTPFLCWGYVVKGGGEILLRQTAVELQVCTPKTDSPQVAGV